MEWKEWDVGTSVAYKALNNGSFSTSHSPEFLDCKERVCLGTMFMVYQDGNIYCVFYISHENPEFLNTSSKHIDNNKWH